MTHAITEHVCKTPRHTTHYLAAGSAHAPLIVFVHGWPELAISWRSQLECFAVLGFRAVAPDMRGYGRSSVHPRHADYAMEELVRDMVELLAHLGRNAAVWVGHNWGAPVVWSMASHHADKCLGVANLCVPYLPQGFAPDTLIPLVDRGIYPEETYPAGQWDYQLYYQAHFDDARRALEADTTRTIKALMRAGNPTGQGRPYRTATIRREGGWFGGAPAAPDVPRDPAVLSEQALSQYASALAANGFFGPDAWYMNAQGNMAFAARAPSGGRLAMPVLFLHARYDWICETLASKLADPMRGACDDLSERIVDSGHWMQQEKPEQVNACLAGWLARRVAAAWPGEPQPS
jgi:pimeloyl-ACP methyl ester carboxylesterase